MALKIENNHAVVRIPEPVQYQCPQHGDRCPDAALVKPVGFAYETSSDAKVIAVVLSCEKPLTVREVTTLLAQTAKVIEQDALNRMSAGQGARPTPIDPSRMN